MEEYNYIIEEIIKIIRDNLKLFIYDDSKLLKLKEHCRERIDKPLANKEIIYFTKESLIDLLKTEHLYDFRDIE